ncbi:MAG: DUF177 domain-containing protein [Syntrophomonadaceae bacterium]|nr:DUF177 domain-containing protein [Syntrophomonadaceae bacterium]
MKLNLRRLKRHPRESEEFLISSPGNVQFLDQLGGDFAAPIEGGVSVENTGSMFIGQGRLKTKVQIPCSRCLQEFIYPVETELAIVLVEGEKSSLVNPNEDFVSFDGDEADIDFELQQAIFMALPIRPVCNDDCQGLCPICGQNKNAQPCSCQEDKTDPRWAKLRDLR